MNGLELTTRPRHRRAFTLLEVILAIGLLSLLIVLCAGMIDFHLKQLTIRKTQVEQAQIARAILRQISDDLRSVVSSATAAGANSSASSDSSSNSSSTNTSSTNSSSTGSTSGNTNSTNTGSSSSTDTSSSSSSSTSSNFPTTLGVYGNAYELQLDVSRVPRFEEYTTLIESDSPTMQAVGGDVRTVTYFSLGNGMSTTGAAMPMSGMQGAGQMTSGFSNDGLGSSTTTGMNGPLGQMMPMRGLARRSLDRASARFAADNGDTTATTQPVEILAPEVLQIEFRYFDGSQWLTEWNSDELGGVPLAVEILLWLTSETNPDDPSNASLNPSLLSNSLSNGGLDPQSPVRFYRLVVALPSAQPVATSSSTTTSNGSSSATSSGSSTSTGGGSS